jgi:hypothetical protein
VLRVARIALRAAAIPAILDIADLDWSADLPLPGSDCGRGFRRSPVKRQHAAAQDLVDGAIEGVTESIAPTAWRQERQAETDFKDCDCRRPDSF